MQERDIRAAKNTVRLYARALGTKRCTHAIDGCFAEIFKSYSQFKARHVSSGTAIDKGLGKQRRWSGMCVFAAELLGETCGSTTADDNRGHSGMPRDRRPLRSELRVISLLAPPVQAVIVVIRCGRCQPPRLTRVPEKFGCSRTADPKPTTHKMGGATPQSFPLPPLLS